MPLGQPLLDLLDGMGYGGLVLGEAGEILHMNRTAARLLSRRGENCRETDVVCSQGELSALLHLGGINWVQLNGDHWMPIQRTNAEAGRPLILRTIPLKNSETAGPHKVMILIDLDVTPRPSIDVLKRVFGLTSAEARLAIELTGGKTAEDVAMKTGVTVGTVRKQLASVFTKTKTHRQPDLVVLVSRLAILP